MTLNAIKNLIRKIFKRFCFSLLLMTIGFHTTYGANSLSPWADSLLLTMTLEEKIGQLFMIPAYSNLDNAHEKSIAKYILRKLMKLRKCYLE